MDKMGGVKQPGGHRARQGVVEGRGIQSKAGCGGREEDRAWQKGQGIGKKLCGQEASQVGHKTSPSLLSFVTKLLKMADHS